MKKSYPFFSVLLSVYSKENPKWLIESLDSILSNTVLPNQIVVVKDGELPKELEDVLNSYSNNPLFLIVGYEENKGLGFALNFGLEYCKYEYVARMDSDDICASNRFERQLELFAQDKDLGLVGSFVYEFIDDPSNIQSIKKVPLTHEDIIKYSKKRNPFNHPSVMFCKQKIMSAGGYLDLFRHEDYYLWYRVIKSGIKTQNLQDCLVYMRVSSNFFKRRGGMKALKARIKLSRIMLKDHFIGVGTHFLVSNISFLNSILPGFLRKFIYNIFLRKKYKVSI